MAITIYKHLSNPKNVTGALSDEFLIAPVSWFEKIANITANGNLNTANKIEGSHIFKKGKGFIKVQCLPIKNILDSNSIGDYGSSIFETELAVNIPGSYAQLHNTFLGLKNVPLIILIRDGNCKDEFYYQLGSDSQFAWMLPSFTTGGGKGAWKGYPLKIKYVHNIIQFYKGEIEKYPNVSILNFSVNENRELVVTGDLEDISNINFHFEVDRNLQLNMHGSPPAGYDFELNDEGELIIQTPL